MKLFLSNRKGRKKAFFLITLLLLLYGNSWATERLFDVMKRRGMTEKGILAAAKTYVQTGQSDDYLVFSAGGQSGQVIVYGIPSMRILKYIAVFTPAPWQSDHTNLKSKALLAQGRIQSKEITAGNTHHPALSETDGDFDGEYLFINDKANPRTAVIDLRDFETKQIVVNPVLKSSHTGTFVSENTEYVIEAAQYPAPFQNEYVPIKQFNDDYRNGITYWHFDRQKGRIDPKKSFTVMTPPYRQDQSDFGKGPSSDWSFTNTTCSGGNQTDSANQSPLVSQCSASEANLLMVNWRQASKMVEAGQATQINNHNVITLDTAVKEGILYLVQAPEVPSSVDVSPEGQYIVVLGQSDDASTSIYSFEKLQTAIANAQFERKSPYGIPIIAMKEVQHLPIELGKAPLYTQYDAQECVAYTLLTEEAMMAKWDYCQGEVLEKMAIENRLSHFITMHGDTKTPQGQYLVALKLAKDRLNPVGLPMQNHQLIDIRGDQMELLKDMPLPLIEAHYAVALNTSLLKPRVASDLEKNAEKRLPPGINAGSEEIKKTSGKVEVFGTISKSGLTPAVIEVEQGDDVIVHLTHLESTENSPLQFALYGQNINRLIEPGQTSTFRLVADNPGVYPIYGSDFRSAGHSDKQGYLLVKPKTVQESDDEEGELLVNYTKADYDKQVKDNLATLVILDMVKDFLNRHQNYKDFPKVVALMEEANQQLEAARRYQAKAELAAVQEDWQGAVLSAIQWWQFQLKAADLGLHAKTNYVEQSDAQKAPPPPTVTYTQADYEQLNNLATQAVIDNAVTVMSGYDDYQDFPEVVALMEKADQQLAIAQQEHKQADEAAAKQDWKNAVLLAKQGGQSQLKSADIYLQAQTAYIGQPSVKAVPQSSETSTAPVVATTTQADYEQLITDNQAEQAALEKALVLILTQNYYQYPEVDALVKEALNQLNQAKTAENGAKAAAVQQDWSKAMLTADKWQQSQKQASKLVSRATTAIEAIMLDKLDGKQLYSDKGCNACHGAEGNQPIQPNYPVVAGQAEDYLVTQMMAVKSGARDNGQTALMKGIIASVKPAEIKAIAKWLASLESEAAGNTNLQTPGAKLYLEQSCHGCHGVDAQTPLLASYPKLAGQNQPYIVAQIKDIQSGARHHDQTEIMKPLIQSLTEEQLQTIADWLAATDNQVEEDTKLNSVVSDK